VGNISIYAKEQNNASRATKGKELSVKKTDVEHLAQSKGYRLSRLGDYEIPDEVLQLQQDLVRIRTAIMLFEACDYRNLSHDFNVGSKAYHLTLLQLRTFECTIKQKNTQFLK